MESGQHSHAGPGVLHMPWEHTALKVLSFGGIATAALALAPIALPAMLSSPNVALAGANAISFCTTNAATGWAGAVAGALGHIPVVGASIAAGGFAAAAMSGGLALGGMWLANYVDKRSEPGAFRWGAVIRWGSLATSALIALPAIIPAISMGLMFFGGLWGVESLQATALVMGSLGKFGAASTMGAATSAAALGALHAVTCALPLGTAGLFLGKKEEEKKEPRTLMVRDMPIVYDGRLTPLAPTRQAAAM